MKFDAKKTALQETLDTKLEAVNHELDPVKAGELLAEAKAARAELEQITAIETDAGELNAWRSTAANAVPAGGMGPGTVHHIKQSGRTEITQEGGKSVLYQEGEGLLSDSQLKTVQSDDYAVAVKSYLRRGGDIGRMSKVDAKSLMEGMDQDGGFLAPAEFIQKLIERLPTSTRIADQVTTLNTGRERVVLPKATYAADDIYSSAVRITWTGEPGAPPLANTPQFGTFAINVYTAMIEAQATNDMIEDSVFPVMSYLSGKMREAWDIERDRTCVLGSGIGQPVGMLTNVDGANGIASYKSGASATVTADAILGITYEIPEQYLENQQFVFNRRSTEQAIAKLKDSQNRYLFSAGTVDQSIATARPNALVGFGILRSALMPDLGANAYPLIHGDLRAHYNVMRLGITLQVLNEVEARNNSKVILARVRHGGDVAEPWRLRVMKCST